jgi:hypothetical protein
MQRDTEDPENEDPDEFEEEESVAELCGAPLVKGKSNKIVQTIVGDLMDRVKRDDARRTAAIQDVERRHVGGTRYDVNSYAGGPVTIPDLCVVEKRKVR